MPAPGCEVQTRGAAVVGGQRIQALRVIQSANKSSLSSYYAPAFSPAEDVAVNNVADTEPSWNTF